MFGLIKVLTLSSIAVFLGVSALAFDPKQELLVSCPAHWPGAITQPPPLTFSEAWIHAISSPKPNDVTIEVNATEPEEASINCRYGDNRFVTVVVPGITSICYPWRDNSANPPRYMYGCLTRPESDGTLKPARTYIVEPVTLKTRIDGLGLGMSRAEILDIAKARGYEVIDGEGSPMRLRVKNDGVTVDFGKANGLSHAIAFHNPSGDFQRIDEAKYRFGLDAERINHYPPGKKSFTTKRWKSRTDSAVLENFPTDDPQRNILRFYDSAAE